jgi:hypothetical protein
MHKIPWNGSTLIGAFRFANDQKRPTVDRGKPGRCFGSAMAPKTMATQAPEAQISDGKPQRYQRINNNVSP